MLTRDALKKGLSDVQRSADQENFAFVRLDLSGLGLTSLGDELQRYKEIRYISLNNNELEDVSEVGVLPHLLSCQAQLNRLKSVPVPAVPLPSVQLLELDSNQIESFDAAALNKFPSLYALSLSSSVLSQHISRCSSSFIGNHIGSLLSASDSETVRNIDAQLTSIQTQILSNTKLLRQLEAEENEHAAERLAAAAAAADSSDADEEPQPQLVDEEANSPRADGDDVAPADDAGVVPQAEEDGGGDAASDSSGSAQSPESASGSESAEVSGAEDSPNPADEEEDVSSARSSQSTAPAVPRLSIPNDDEEEVDRPPTARPVKIMRLQNALNNLDKQRLHLEDDRRRLLRALPHHSQLTVLDLVCMTRVLSLTHNALSLSVVQSAAITDWRAAVPKTSSVIIEKLPAYNITTSGVIM